MSFKMKGWSGYQNSPVKKTFDYSKKADYSKEATKDNFGSKLADALTPDISGDNTAWENISAVATELAPIGKIGKAAKYIYKYFKGDENDKT